MATVLTSRTVAGEKAGVPPRAPMKALPSWPKGSMVATVQPHPRRGTPVRGRRRRAAAPAGRRRRAAPPPLTGEAGDQASEQAAGEQASHDREQQGRPLVGGGTPGGGDQRDHGSS